MIPLALRLATAEDTQLVWRCRQEIAGGTAIQNNELDSFAHHAAWMESAVDSPEVLFLIPVLNSDPVGYVRFNREEKGLSGSAQSVWRTSICVLAAKRASGLGQRILKIACERAEEADKSPQVADIHRDNIASLRIFTHCGFSRLSPKANSLGYHRYIRSA